MTVTHVFDPNGDVTLVLRDLDAAFAGGCLAPRKNRKFSSLSDDDITSDPDTEESDMDEIAIEEMETPSEGAGEDSVDDEYEKNDRFSSAPLEVRYQVSSAHLILASPVFKRALTGHWKESVEFKTKGSVELAANRWNEETF
ncbi:hypothetical protein BDW74DRAFT_182784 [Aspergillus multicolor]|uniref:uncharacterized protein n=1 Tax=Aspergillus multicolor TaxID=41759 RepID=UPI003CCDEA25